MTNAEAREILKKHETCVRQLILGKCLHTLCGRYRFFIQPSKLMCAVSLGEMALATLTEDIDPTAEKPADPKEEENAAEL